LIIKLLTVKENFESSKRRRAKQQRLFYITHVICPHRETINWKEREERKQRTLPGLPPAVGRPPGSLAPYLPKARQESAAMERHI
jgi:hypothetical protein